MEEPTRTVDGGVPPVGASDRPPGVGAADTANDSWGPRRGAGAAGALVRTLLQRVRGPVARGALLSVFLTGLGTALAYPVQVFVSRTLGASEYGRYAYVLGIMNVAALVAALDLGGAALRFVGFYNANAEWSLLRGFLRTSRSLVVGLSTFVAVAGAGVIVLLGDRLEPELRTALLAACVLLVPAAVLQLELNLLQGLRRVSETRIPNLLVRPLGFALILFLATYVFRAPRTASSAVLSNAAGTAIALGLSLVYLRRVWPAAARRAPAETRTGEWLRFGGTSLAGSLLYMILSQQSDIIIVGSVVGTTDAGLYSAAAQISTLVLFGVSAITHFASPMIAEYQDRHRAPQLRALVRRFMLLNWAVSLPLVAVLLIGGRLLLRTFGPEFPAAYPVLAVLLVAQTINAAWGTLWGTLLTMTGFQKQGVLIVVAVATLNMAMTMVLTPRFGVIGAAAATCGAVLVRGGLVAWVVHRKMGFWPLWWRARS